MKNAAYALDFGITKSLFKCLQRLSEERATEDRNTQSVNTGL